MRAVISLISGTLLAFVVASIIGTQTVLASVQSMGLDVTFAMRWSSSVSDLAGLSTSLLPLMAIVLVPVWLILSWCDRRALLHATPFWYAAAGGICIAALHPVMTLVFGVDVFAAARSWPGLLGQAFAGALGGHWVAYLWRSKPDAT